MVRDAGVGALFQNPDAVCWGDVRADQYGIRTRIGSIRADIKFEIVLEGRIELSIPAPGNQILGVPTLTRVDSATEKLLANSDWWNDSSVHRRDLIDLAMMQLTESEFARAYAKAEAAYGASIGKDLINAIAHMEAVDGVLQQCRIAMGISTPLAQLWGNIRKLRTLFEKRRF